MTTSDAPTSDAHTTPSQDDDAPALTLHGVQRSVDAWMGQWKDGYWPALANLARLTEEVGELARELNHRHGPKRKKGLDADTDAASKARVADEMADILFVVVALANSEGIDLDTAFRRMMTKLNIRDADRWERAE